MSVLKAAIDAAKKNSISTIAVASTSGDTASKLFDLVKTEKLRLIVVTHDEGRATNERRFDEDIRRRLLANNVTVYTHNPSMILARKIMNNILGKLGLPTWYKHLAEIRAKYGTGIKVCHIIVHMLMESKAIRGGRIIAIAGTKKGADSAAIFSVRLQDKRPILEKVISKEG